MRPSSSRCSRACPGSHPACLFLEHTAGPAHVGPPASMLTGLGPSVPLALGGCAQRCIRRGCLLSALRGGGLGWAREQQGVASSGGVALPPEPGLRPPQCFYGEGSTSQEPAPPPTVLSAHVSLASPCRQHESQPPLLTPTPSSRRALSVPPHTQASTASSITSTVSGFPPPVCLPQALSMPGSRHLLEPALAWGVGAPNVKHLDVSIAPPRSTS